MKKKADLIADYEAQIHALYGGIERRDEKIRSLERRIEVLRVELSELYIELQQLTVDTIEKLSEGAGSQ